MEKTQMSSDNNMYYTTYDQINGYSKSTYYRGFRNQIIRLTTLWKPVGKYEIEPLDASATAASAPAAKAKLVQRDGLEITVKGSETGSYFRLRVPCTDDLWDNIWENRIWQYKEDIIYLKFDEDGTAYEYILKPDATKPVGEYSDKMYKPPVPRAQTLIDERNKESNSVDKNYMGTVILFNVDKNRNVKFINNNSSIPKDVSNSIKTLLETKIKDGEDITKFDILDNKYLVVDVKNNGEFIFVDTKVLS